MKNLFLSLCSIVLLSANFAQAMETGMSTMLTSYATEADSNGHMILQAKEDAYAFVATEGQIRGVRFEAALKDLRSKFPALRSATDMDIALGIASY